MLLTYIFVAVFCFAIGYQQAALKYRELEAAVRQQRNLATERLAELTAERDKKQAALNKAAKDQEDRDREAQTEIERLAGDLADRPVRVRYVTGSCGGGPAGGSAADAQSGAGGGAEASGLLPDSNTKRLGAALKEIETLSAAYNSCRARLLSNYRAGGG